MPSISIKTPILSDAIFYLETILAIFYLIPDNVLFNIFLS